MKNYAAFLRGINISGKNKIAMSELKSGFERLGFTEVKTYLNSGNVIFSSDKCESELCGLIESMLECDFALSIPVFVISVDALNDIVSHAPTWWGTGDKEIYDNLIFIMPPTDFTEVLREIGEPKAGLEQIENYKQAIFWSFSLKHYQKTNWWPKTASADIGKRLTIRTAGTVRKLCALAAKA